MIIFHVLLYCISIWSVSLAPISGMDPLLAAAAGARYLLNSKENDEFRPRVAIGVSFLRDYLDISEQENALIYDLDSQLLFAIDEMVIENLPVHILATQINSRYAMCEDPRDFNGNDLVDLLRKKVGGKEFNLPVVYLALCFGRDTRLEDFEDLIAIYDSRGDRVATKALTVISMAACRNLANIWYFNEMKYRAEDFVRKFNIFEDVSTYSKGLIYQAHNAWGYDTSEFKNELLKLQAEDGSFGDLLGTYAAIPALLNTSLADLQCKTRTYEGKQRSAEISPKIQRSNSIDYSIVIQEGMNVGSHTLNIRFTGRKSLYQLMQIAAQKNPFFKFTYDELEGSGKKLHSISGIVSDAETGLLWVLYKEDSLTKEEVREQSDLDYLFPQDGDHYIFRLEYDSPL